VTSVGATGVPAARAALVKGAVIREFLLWYEARHRLDRARVLERVDADERHWLNVDEPALGILVSEFYPSSVLFPILDVVCEPWSESERTGLAREANAIVVAKLSRGIYAALFRTVATPARYAKYIQRVWNVLHTTGRRQLVIEREGFVRSTTRDWPGHHPFLCEVTMETMRAVFEAMGCADVSVERMSCVSQGAGACTAVLSYASRARLSVP
jgi:hypothetical protein